MSTIIESDVFNSRRYRMINIENSQNIGVLVNKNNIFGDPLSLKSNSS